MSPIPGIFYRKPNPNAEPFVAEGQRVEVGQVVGLVEVMKSFFEVKADVAGVVAAFLVENEGPVEAGQPLVQLEASDEAQSR
jgi:acetyl-CoA carboxylase biotin carboxyl carrier protein